MKIVRMAIAPDSSACLAFAQRIQASTWSDAKRIPHLQITERLPATTEAGEDFGTAIRYGPDCNESVMEKAKELTLSCLS